MSQGEAGPGLGLGPGGRPAACALIRRILIAPPDVRHGGGRRWVGDPNRPPVDVAYQQHGRSPHRR
jgi:hypothetical protein